MKDRIKKVKVAPKAQTEFNDLVANIEQYQSKKVAKKFTKDFEQTLNQLKKTPKLFPLSTKKKGARRALFSQYGAFLYRIVKKTTLRIITFYDTRMNR